jgi:oligopeptide transport system ATP-binding protein
MTNPILDVRDLSVEFKTQDGIVKAVNGISYTLQEGETIGIVGESGSGKSVGVMSLVQLIPQPPGRIVSGSAILKGKDLIRLSQEEICAVRGRDISIIFQDPMTSLNPVLKIERQMTEALELHLKLNRSDSKARALEMLKKVSIPGAEARINDYPHQFSGGMRQRVMIAMALVCHPDILIADEPTTALDVTIQAQIIRLVKQLRDDLGMAIIWISHDLGVVAGIAEKVLVMYSGYIVEQAPVDSLYHNPAHPYTIGLLNSLPRVDQKRSDMLFSIEGMPPELTDLSAGCPFAPRCSFTAERCLLERPELKPIGDDHYVACWFNEKARSVK